MYIIYNWTADNDLLFFIAVNDSLFFYCCQCSLFFIAVNDSLFFISANDSLFFIAVNDLLFFQEVKLDNKMYRTLIDFHGRNHNLTWVNRFARAKITISDSEFNAFERKKRKHIKKNLINDDKFLDRSEAARTTEIRLSQLITTHLSNNEGKTNFRLLPDILHDFEEKELSELPQVIVIS